MPAYQNTIEVKKTCLCCKNDYFTKRPDSSKYCSTLCASRSRPPRVSTPEYNKQYREKRLLEPGYRENENQKARERSYKVKDWIYEYKLNHGCIDCGYNLHPMALDFDHQDGKTSNVANLKSISAVKEEIKKHNCVIRCANCHRIKTYENQDWIKK